MSAPEITVLRASEIGSSHIAGVASGLKKPTVRIDNPVNILQSGILVSKDLLTGRRDFVFRHFLKKNA